MEIETAQPEQLSTRAAEEIRAMMGRRQLRQTQLARRIGVNDQWLSVRLRGLQEIGLNDLQLIADGLGVSPATLLGAALGQLDTLRNPSLTHKPRSARPHTPRVDKRPQTAQTGPRRTAYLHR